MTEARAEARAKAGAKAQAKARRIRFAKIGRAARWKPCDLDTEIGTKCDWKKGGRRYQECLWNRRKRDSKEIASSNSRRLKYGWAFSLE